MYKLIVHCALIVFFILSGMIIPTQSAQAGQRVPMVHWYNASTGTTAVGYIDGNDSYHQLSTPGDFSSGWSHMIHLPDNYLFAYNAQNGAGAIVWLNNAGAYSTVASYGAGSFTYGWSTVVPIGTVNQRPRIFFYRASDGLAALGEVASDGSLRTITSYPIGYFGADWTNIVYTGRTGILFYNGTTGTAEVGTISSNGTYRTRKLHEHYFSTGWTHIVAYFSNAKVVYYNANTGALAIGELDRTGNHTTLRSYRYKAGWTALTPMHGKMLFYKANTGGADIARVSNNGQFSYSSWQPGTFSTGWNSVVYGF